VGSCVKGSRIRKAVPPPEDEMMLELLRGVLSAICYVPDEMMERLAAERLCPTENTEQLGLTNTTNIQTHAHSYI